MYSFLYKYNIPKTVLESYQPDHNTKVVRQRYQALALGTKTHATIVYMWW